MRKRDRLEVIHDMLKVIADHNNAIKPTPLLRYSNLSSQRFAEYFGELLAKEFVTEEQDKKGRKVIALTDRGYRYLQRYDTIRGFIDDFNL